MPAGRPAKANPGALYAFAHQFYWDLRKLAKGFVRILPDEKRQSKLLARLERVSPLINDSDSVVRRAHREMKAAQKVRKLIRVPGEWDVLKTLLNPATTPKQIRELCKEFPAWPNYADHTNSTVPLYLSKYAEQWVDALHDPRFPRCDASSRPSNRLKQLWFVSRALAGALYGVTTRTAVNLVGSMRPEQIFEESGNAKPVRRKRRTKKSS
jgi:hypothetical protein